MLAFLFGLVQPRAGHSQAPDGGNSASARTACVLSPGPTRAVTRIIDAETIGLDDGTEVRLIGALAPRAPDAMADLSFWPPERDARAALERLVLGRSVTLAFAGRRTDRYGRVLAHVLVEPTTEEAALAPDAERIWVQGHLLAHGHARAYVLKDNIGCLRELAGHEMVARRAGLGLWGHAAYQIRDAGGNWELTRLRSSFQVVEGEVTGVVAGRTVLVLRFGREPEPAAEVEETKPLPRGFSIAIKPQIVRAWAAIGLSLADMQGRRLRIHGWIERRGGPAIEILDPHQIELVDDADAAAVAGVAAAADEPVKAPPRRRSRAGQRAAALAPVPQ